MPLTKPTSEQVEFLNAVNLPGDLAVVGALTAGNLNAGSLTATAISGPGTIPLGGIIMWSGSTVPAGWALCDGQIVNSIQTPNLVDKFVIGGLAYSAGAWQTQVTGANSSQGGNKDSVLVAHTHTPSLSTDTAAAHSHGTSGLTAASAGAHTHTYTVYTNQNSFQPQGTGFNSLVCTGENTNTGATTGSAGAHTHTLSGTLDSAGAHSHAITGSISSAGTGAGTNENLPPYFALAYIMRVL